MNSIFEPNRYAEVVRVREHPPVLLEEWVQRIWFEQLVQNPLRDREGRSVEVLQPGLWNKGPGPDFHHAALRIAGEVVSGELEVHLRSGEWKAHGHDRDPAYNGVIGHLVWERKGTPAVREDGETPVEIELKDQVSAPLAELGALFTATASEEEVGARAGRCQRVLAGMGATERMDLLREAGRHRFNRRVALARARVRYFGVEHCLWVGLADALGYSRNREPFRCLANRLPVDQLRERSALQREAILYGQAGFLPDRAMPTGTAREWARQVWSEWWQQRPEDLTPPVGGWNRKGLRPVNRPERRLAVLALVSDPARWNVLVSRCRTADRPELYEFFQNLDHPYWGRHATVGGRTFQEARALMGASRVDSFLFNVVWPLAAAEGRADVYAAVEEARTGESMLPARVAAVRLLGKTVPRQARQVLVQEGLIQIYQDFCLQEFEACRQCEFPELVARFKNA